MSAENYLAIVAVVAIACGITLLLLRFVVVGWIRADADLDKKYGHPSPFLLTDFLPVRLVFNWGVFSYATRVVLVLNLVAWIGAWILPVVAFFLSLYVYPPQR